MADQMSARSKADRGAMASQVAALAVEFGLTAVHRIEEPGTRRTSVDLAGPHGLRLTVKFDGAGPDPNIYVLSWHGVDAGYLLSPDRFSHVNPHHGRKATDVAHGATALLDRLRIRFAAIADGSAFVAEPPHGSAS